MNLRKIVLATACLGAATTGLVAQVRDVVTPAAFVFNGQQFQISQAGALDTSQVAQHFQRPSDCPGVCVSPMTIAAQIPTIGEHDVIAFVTQQVSSGQGLLLDSRTQGRRATGFIAGSVNVPVTLLAPDNPFLTDILLAMGATRSDKGIDFSTALPLVVFDDGPTSADAEKLIAGLRDAGYPDSKIQYYRGGMQVWSALGLSVEDAS